jgi:hypothetical protein
MNHQGEEGEGAEEGTNKEKSNVFQNSFNCFFKKSTLKR